MGHNSNSSNNSNIWNALNDSLAQNKACVLATIIEAQGSVPRHVGAKMLVLTDGQTVGSVGGGALEKVVIEEALLQMQQGEPRLLKYKLKPDLNMACGGSADVFLDPLLPSSPLYIFGAGHIGRELAPLAHQLGFAVTMIDERTELANAQNFPQAKQIIHSYSPAAWPKIVFSSRAFCVVVTPSHASDFSVTKALLSVEPGPAYIGMIGSKNKRQSFEREMQEAGMSETQISRLHSPIGLSIGAESPTEIALSIAAELVQVRRHTLNT